MRSRSLLMILCMALLLLTGCWNNRELGTLAIVTAIGLDKGKNQNEHVFSFQVVNPSAVISGTVGQGDENMGPVTVYTETGETLFEAARKASQKAPRRLFFSHVRYIMIGEQLARQGINGVLDSFERSNEIRLTARLVIAKGRTAQEVLAIVTPMEKIPATAGVGALEFSEELWGESIKIEFDDVIRAIGNPGREPMISAVELLGNPRAGQRVENIQLTKPDVIEKIGGIGAFRTGKLVGWLEGEQARGVNWLHGSLKSSVLMVDCDGKKDQVGIEIIRSKTDIQGKVVQGKPQITVTITEEASIADVKCAIHLSSPAVIYELANKLEDKTMLQIMSAVKAAQQYKTDIFGFGEVIRRADPKAWGHLKLDWPDRFSQLPVEVKVKAFIRQPGMITEPYLLKRDKKIRDE
ncbi:Ger(x)C family spore germination protein [Brevibacillus borstelensis]|uniref:Ger(x)C family spore germination protein n=1 Tax=Brevibacillus borstelensis TaxID=45462 RepID=UPI0004F39690|nr:Ger(x)C family spore germination protein [Brevibacillus borstelensis]KKX53790.1 hypothetical protein X546_18205 [Brevibacillus borstelensis cifa_chp40]